jgi:CRP-like cAMP-binding protein
VTLPDDCVATLIRKSYPLSLRRGEVLFDQGQEGNECYWVGSGLLKGSIGAGDGRSLVVSVHGPGDLVGDICDFVEQTRVTTVDAISRCELTVIDYSSFRSALEDYPEFSRWLTCSLARRTRATYLDQAAHTRRTPSRVAHALLKVAQLAGEPLDDRRVGIPSVLSHEVLASIAGVSRESASRALGAWRKQGIVGRSHGFPMVIQKQAIELERSR